MPELYMVAKAEIRFRSEWNLPASGRAVPLEYWAHIRFEGDTERKTKLWTVFIKLDKPHRTGEREFSALIYFLSPIAPVKFFIPKERFQLCICERVLASGVIIENLGLLDVYN